MHEHMRVSICVYLSDIHEDLTANCSGTDITKEQRQFVGAMVSFMCLLLPALWLAQEHP